VSPAVRLRAFPRPLSRPAGLLQPLSQRPGCQTVRWIAFPPPSPPAFSTTSPKNLLLIVHSNPAAFLTQPRHGLSPPFFSVFPVLLQEARCNTTPLFVVRLFQRVIGRPSTFSPNFSLELLVIMGSSLPASPPPPTTHPRVELTDPRVAFSVRDFQVCLVASAFEGSILGTSSHFRDARFNHCPPPV